MSDRKTSLNLDILSFGTLRKYQYFFNVKPKEGQELPHEREEVIEAVKNDFSGMKVDQHKVVQRFLKLKKDDKALQGDIYNLRKKETITRQQREQMQETFPNYYEK